LEKKDFIGSGGEVIAVVYIV